MQRQRKEQLQMGNTPQNNTKKNICIGILAHVDAGKTTLSESMLYHCGSIRRLGRVDHKDAFLDNYELEKERGITIFSKQAQFSLGEMNVTLLDTPGHVDFSAEMERTLQVLDYAILVISASDGVQGHTETLWKLLERYRIPVFIFVNKTDLEPDCCHRVQEELQERLDSSCISFTQDTEQMFDDVAMCDEAAMDEYLENGCVSEGEIIRLIRQRRVFPCYYGSALQQQGVEEFLQGLGRLMQVPEYPEEFGARVFKIARDEQGQRLTYMKITGGELKVRMPLGDTSDKVSQIRIYSGSRYTTADVVSAGGICAVPGLEHTYPGMGYGITDSDVQTVLEPVLNYQVLLPEGCDAHKMLSWLRQLEEEDPQLHIFWNEQLKEIQLQLMGEVQLEVLQRLIEDRFGVVVEFGTGNIVYKETISMPVEGVGHYEPLRHYAEVHLLLQPLERGSGLVFESECSEDMLDRNWQRLILTHLQEREHLGVLTGSPVTDMKITLLAGRAHLKHTEGGDFREATYRAVRHGLMLAHSILLEPYYSFRLELPVEYVGRAMTDIQRMDGSFGEPGINGEQAVVTGRAPVAAMAGYQTEVLSYTQGRGRLSCEADGYDVCQNSQEIIEQRAYEPERDLAHSADSVFCSHGAGYVVKWNEVYDHMHLERAWLPGKPNTKNSDGNTGKRPPKAYTGYSGSWEEDKELEAIFTRTFGEIKRRPVTGESRRTVFANSTGKPDDEPASKLYQKKAAGAGDKYLLVDGYNIVFAWEDLNKLAQDNLDAARYKLMDRLSNYQGYTGVRLICVFDAYKVKGSHGSVEKYHNIDVVYTKEAETADMYIEKVTLELGKKHQVTVATSDRLEQLIIAGHGAVRISAGRLREEVERIEEQLREEYDVQ